MISPPSARTDPDADKILRYAVLHVVTLIGEAASKISADTRELAPDIPWIQISGMRNRLVHAYFNVELNLIWDTVNTDIPTLLTRLQTLIKPHDV